MKTLFCVLGRSGTGKDTVVDRVCQLTGMKKVCSYTTRPKRVNEGDTHIFVQPEDVDKYKDDIIAQTVIGDVEYFATVTQVLNSDFYIIDPKGLGDLWKYWNFKKHPLKIVVVLISVPADVQRRFLMKRGDDVEIVQKRMAAEDAQFCEFEKEYKNKYVLTNLDLTQTVNDLLDIIKREKEED